MPNKKPQIDDFNELLKNIQANRHPQVKPRMTVGFDQSVSMGQGNSPLVEEALKIMRNQQLLDKAKKEKNIIHEDVTQKKLKDTIVRKKTL